VNLAIAYVTGRPDPRLDWAIDALVPQARAEDELTLIVVDALERPAAAIGFYPHPMIVDLIECAPKPTPWQGKHRLTTADWWAMSNARNTAFVWCPPDVDYVAFLDDRCVPGPRWLDVVRDGFEKRQSVICGAYEKHEDGRVSVDNRRQVAPAGKTGCGGNWLYGCTFALPLEWALEVNGFEEGMDGLSFEDVIFGLNLANAGRRVDYRPDLFVTQHRGAAQARIVGPTRGRRRTTRATPRYGGSGRGSGRSSRRTFASSAVGCVPASSARAGPCRIRTCGTGTTGSSSAR